VKRNILADQQFGQTAKQFAKRPRMKPSGRDQQVGVMTLPTTELDRPGIGQQLSPLPQPPADPVQERRLHSQDGLSGD
jgi:hypothetical protein